MTVECGTAADAALLECQRAVLDCSAQAAAAPPGVVLVATAVFTWTGGAYVQSGVSCAPQAVAGVPEPAVREAVARLVPTAAIGAAPKATALVNAEALFWVQTPAQQKLAAATLLGHQVAITIKVASVSWDFGDGSKDTSDGPGRVFGPGDHCGTAQCPDWFGHTYTQTGAVTVRAVAHWTASYTVDGGAAQQIIGTVDGPAAQLAVTVKQARTVLVPNPTQS